MGRNLLQQAMAASLCALLLTLAARADSQADDLWRQGKEAALAHPQQALQLFNRALEKNPNHALAYCDRGELWLRMGRKDLAWQDFNQSFRISPNHKAATELGVFCDGRDDGEQAIKYYSEAIRFDPKDTLPYEKRGKAYQIAGNLAAAIRDFQKALALNSTDAEACRLMGACLYGQKSYGQALKVLDQAIQMEKKLGWKAYCELELRAQTHEELGEYTTAVADFRASLKERSYDKVELELVKALLKLGRNAEAEVELDKMVAHNPKDEDVFLKRASVLLLLNQTQKALLDYKTAAALDDESFEAQDGMAVCYEKLGQKELALKARQQSQRLHKRSLEL